MATPEQVLAETDPKRVVGTAKILTIDIERAPGLARFYDLKTHYISPRSVKEWPRTTCFAARWYNDPEPIFAAEWTGKKSMLRKAWQLYDEADIVVTYNGRRFDNKHLASEWKMVGLAPPRPWKDVDLFTVVKAQFGFESKSLDSVTKRLGRPGKSHPFDLDMMVRATDGKDAQARADLELYNMGDVELTEWLYDELRGWIPTHPHVGSFGDEKVCNQCGREALKLQPTTYRAIVIDYALYRCTSCGANVKGGWHSRAASTRGVR